MVRFIFVCMGVVALSFLTIAAQYMIDGIQNAQQEVAARNDAETVVAVEETISPEELNAIDTAAGADADAAAPGNQTFGDAFTAEAPAALRDQDAPQALGAVPAETLTEEQSRFQKEKRRRKIPTAFFISFRRSFRNAC